jgi:hypothetical protein
MHDRLPSLRSENGTGACVATKWPYRQNECRGYPRYPTLIEVANHSQTWPYRRLWRSCILSNIVTWSLGNVWVKYLHHLKEYNAAYMMWVKYTKIIKWFKHYWLKLSAVFPCTYMRVLIHSARYLCAGFVPHWRDYDSVFSRIFRGWV